MSAPPSLRRMTGKLGFRLALLLAITLSPLTLISVLKSTDVVAQAKAASEAALIGETMRAAAPQLQLIQEAQGTAATLARLVGLVSDNEDRCSELMAQAIRGHDRYGSVGYVPLSGIMRCSSAGKPYDLSKNPLFVQLAAAPRPGFTVARMGPVTGLSILATSHPVFDKSGSYLGIIIVSLLKSAMDAAGPAVTAATPLAKITFDRDGEVLTWPANLPDVTAVLPRDRPLADFVGGAPTAFSAQSNDGRERVFSVVTLVPDELYALGTWAPQGQMVIGSNLWLAPILFPVLLFLASLFLAWLGVEWLVIRHIRKLSTSINSFSTGNRVVGDIDVGRAPAELREMADAYERMTETILHDEAELEDMVHQKQVLIREVHHRVKNNLQLIASIINLQMRRARTSEAREMMKGLQDRVMSLATVHRELYQTSGLTDIHVDELLTDIVRQVVNLASGPGQRFEVKSTFADIRMTPDQAVPLALLLTEALTNAIKYAGGQNAGGQNGGGQNGGAPWVEVSLKRGSASTAVLSVANSLSGSAADSAGGDEDHVGIGNQLLDAFALQLGASIDRSDGDGTYSLSACFDLRPLAEAEARHNLDGENRP